MKSIITSIPIDKTSAMVVSKGIHYKPNKNLEKDSELPLPIDTTKKCNLIGVKRGRLTVLGYSLTVKKKLVVRCDCGRYTMRNAKAIKNRKNQQDRCEECRHLAYLKRKHKSIIGL